MYLKICYTLQGNADVEKWKFVAHNQSYWRKYLTEIKKRIDILTIE